MALDFFTFTRNSIATQIREDGSLDSNIAVDVPVINYIDGQFAGYYSQRSATNLLLRSEEFNNAYWTKQDVTLGSQDAQGFTLMSDTATTAIHIIYRGAVLYASDGVLRTTSFWIKKGTARYVRVGIRGDGTLSAAFALMDLELGLIDGASGGWSFIRHKDLYQIFHTSTPSVAGANRRWHVAIYNNNKQASYLGDGSLNVFLRGAQVELGNEATSFIQTISASVTRAPDVATLSNASDLIGQTAGSIEFKAEFPINYPININGLESTVSGTNTIRFEYSPTEIKLFVNDTLADSDIGVFNFGTLDEIQLGHLNGSNQPNFEIRDFIVRKA